MAANVQFKGTSTSAPTPSTAYVGPAREVVVDTDTWCLRVQDGSTPGGHEICPSEVQTTSPAVVVIVSTGTSTTVSPTTWYTQVIWESSTSGAKTTNIPGAGSVNTGYIIGVATTLNNDDTHTIVPASGTIGKQSSVSFTDSQASGSNVSLMSDGVSNWILL